MAQAPASNFEYTNGNHPLKDVEQTLDTISSFCNAPVFPANITLAAYSTSSLLPLGASVATGSIAVVATSGAPAKLYVFTGGGSLSGWATASLGG